MIHPQDGQRGMMGQQHGLQRLTETLEALSKGQTAQQTCTAALQEQLSTLAQRVGTWSRRLVLAVGVLGGLTLVVAGLVGWQMTHPPEQGYARALGSIDTILVQQWGSLPTGSQEALADTYRRLGLLPPSQRK